jgi:hypothetical protein
MEQNIIIEYQSTLWRHDARPAKVCNYHIVIILYDSMKKVMPNNARLSLLRDFFCPVRFLPVSDVTRGIDR